MRLPLAHNETQRGWLPKHAFILLTLGDSRNTAELKREKPPNGRGNMGKILENLNLVLVIGLVLAIGVMMGFHADALNAAVVLRWLHVFFGVLWIGLLYYFNFIQIPTM